MKQLPDDLITMRTPSGEVVTITVRELLCDHEPVKVRRRKVGKPTLQKHLCPHCHKTGIGPTMVRYHFDNCKHKETTK